MDLFGITWRLGLTLFFVLLNGFFVATEFALVKVRTARIDELARTGKKSAKSVQHILKHLDLYLSSCQLGITLASLVLGALGEPAVSRILIGLAGSAGLHVEDAAWLPFVSIGLAFFVITILHMTVGEQAPKMWALERSESMSLRTSGPLRLFTLIFKPFILLINVISNWMLRVGGLSADDHGHGGLPSVAELRGILISSALAGQISDKQLEITQNVFRLIELEVRHVMVPRVDVQYLSLTSDKDEILATLRASSHSRFPVCEHDLDSIVGFVHGKDILESLIAGEELDLRALARTPLFVSDTMALSDLLREMQGKRVHLAAVIDEHGTTTGLAFREDALEEIVGPLGDEFDEDTPEFRSLGEGGFEAKGSIAFPDLCARLEVTPADDEGEETAAGYVVARLGRLPKEGDSVELGDYRLTAASVSRRRITRIRIRQISKEPPPPPQEEA